MNAVEVVAAVVGSCAAVGALVWAMLGNPSMPAWLTARRRSSALRRRTVKRKVVKVDWKELEDAAGRFAINNATAYDLVVGLQPDGVSLANLLASRLSTRYAAIDKRYTKVKRIPFFVFEKETHARSTRPSTTHFVPPQDIQTTPRVLVVDGVTTFGNALNKAAEAVCKEYASAQVDFYVFAVDLPRLAAAHPDITGRLSYHRSIDNFVTWLRFPWDAP